MLGNRSLVVGQTIDASELAVRLDVVQVPEHPAELDMGLIVQTRVAEDENAVL